MSTSSEEQNHDSDDIVEEHLAWTVKQGNILTGGGKAEALYTANRGFPFHDEELPHYHLLKRQTHVVFREWSSSKEPAALVCGAWSRPLFVGGWQHTTDKDERVYNIQTHNLFVDLRVPRSREVVLPTERLKSLTDLSGEQLRLYARQHVFAGYSLHSEENGKPLCTRHHCIDWNFVGSGRTRPNKWWIKKNEDGTCWKESSYATDEDNQHYYFERWEVLRDHSKVPRLALRVRPRPGKGKRRDGVFVVVGDHFNYVLERAFTGEETVYDETSTVALVDAAVAAGDLPTARSYLSIEAGHGLVSKNWQVDCAIPPWKEGENLFGEDVCSLIGEDLAASGMVWRGEEWEIFDCSFKDMEELRSFVKPR